MLHNTVLVGTEFLKQMQPAIIFECKSLSVSVSTCSEWGKSREKYEKYPQGYFSRKISETAWNIAISSVQVFVFKVN